MGERKDGDPQVDRGHGGFSEREAKPLTTSDFSETVVELFVERTSSFNTRRLSLDPLPHHLVP